MHSRVLALVEPEVKRTSCRFDRLLVQQAGLRGLREAGVSERVVRMGCDRVSGPRQIAGHDLLVRGKLAHRQGRPWRAPAPRARRRPRAGIGAEGSSSWRSCARAAVLPAGPTREVALSQTWVDGVAQPVDAVKQPLQIPSVGLRSVPCAPVRQAPGGVWVCELLDEAHRSLPDDGGNLGGERLEGQARGVPEHRDIRLPVALAVCRRERGLGVYDGYRACRDERRERDPRGHLEEQRAEQVEVRSRLILGLLGALQP